MTAGPSPAWLEAAQAVLDAARVLRDAGWDEQRIALAMGHRHSWALYEKLTRQAIREAAE